MFAMCTNLRINWVVNELWHRLVVLEPAGQLNILLVLGWQCVREVDRSNLLVIDESVTSNTFRCPAMIAKAVTRLNATSFLVATLAWPLI